MARALAYLVDGYVHANGRAPIPLHAAKPRVLGENCVFVSPTDGKEFEIIVREKLPAGLEPSSDVVPTDPLSVPGDEEADALSDEGTPEVGDEVEDELGPPESELDAALSGEEEEVADAGDAEAEADAEAELAGEEEEPSEPKTKKKDGEEEGEEDEEDEEKKKAKGEAFTSALRVVAEGGDPRKALARYAECSGMGGISLTIVVQRDGPSGESPTDDSDPGFDDSVEVPAMGATSVEDTLGDEYPDEELEAL